MGLDYLAKVANKVVGGDIDEDILRYAHNTYKGRKNIEIRKADAQKLPFEENTFDVAVLYEAIYYLSQPEKFVDEAKRVLRDDEILIICTVNKDWSDFNLSPFTTKYFYSSELYQLLNHNFPRIEMYGAFLTSTHSINDKVASLIKRTTVALHLMPKTMKGKAYLKRIFFGKLIPLPGEVKNGVTEYSDPRPISCRYPNTQYKVLYGVAYAQYQ